MEHIRIFLDIFRTNNVVLYIIFVCSTWITFDFYNIRERLGITGLDQYYFAVVGALCLVSFASLVFVLINTLFSGVLELLKSQANERKLNKKIEDTLKKLSKREMCILGIYYFDEVDTTWLPMQGPEITSLVSKEILYLSSKNGRGTASGNIIFHYSLNPIVKDKILEHLKFFFGNLSQDELKEFHNEYYPDYMYSVNMMKEFMFK